MAVQRGIVYDYRNRSPKNVGLLVLTGDLWNEGMPQVGAIPIITVLGEEEPTATRLSTAPELRAWPGRLLLVEQGRLTASLFRLAKEDMSQIEEALCHILSLPELCAEVPVQPATPPGRVDYPHWSEIYYSKRRIGQEHKRYVVVSNDLWNRSTQTAMVVRTTTSPARHAPGFPWIQGGKAKACAGEVVTVPAHELQLRPSERPYPSSLPRKDMITIAREIVATHELAGTLLKRGIICP